MAEFDFSNPRIKISAQSEKERNGGQYAARSTDTIRSLFSAGLGVGKSENKGLQDILDATPSLENKIRIGEKIQQLKQFRAFENQPVASSSGTSRDSDRAEILIHDYEILKENDAKIAVQPSVSSPLFEGSRHYNVAHRVRNSSFSRSPERRRSSAAESPPRSRTPVPDYYTFHPKISERSNDIANKATYSEKKLGNQRQIDRPTTPENFPFKPSINKKSEKIAHRSRFSGYGQKKSSIWQSLYELDEHRRQKKEQLKREYADAQASLESECTFKPKTSNTKKTEDPRKVIARLYAWGKMREDKLKIARDIESEKGIEECTFNPTISDLHSFSNVNILSKKGVVKYIERQTQARKKQAEKEEYWNNIPGSGRKFQRTRTPIPVSLSNLEYTDGLYTESSEMDPHDYVEALKKLHQELHSNI